MVSLCQDEREREKDAMRPLVGIAITLFALGFVIRARPLSERGVGRESRAMRTWNLWCFRIIGSLLAIGGIVHATGLA